MKTSTLLRMIMICLLSLSLHAGDEIGNGGDVVVCKNQTGEISSARLLDYYEGENRGFSLDLGEKELPVLEKVQLALNRLEQRDAVLAYLLKESSKNFMQQTLFKKKIILRNISDSEEVYVEQNCEVSQIAINQKVVMPGDKKYIISEDLWNLLDNDNKAGVILHEILYDRFSAIGHSNSRSARYLNSKISSASFLDLSWSEYKQLQKELKYWGKIKLFEMPESIDPHIGEVFTFVNDTPQEIFDREGNLECIFAKEITEVSATDAFFDRYLIAQETRLENLTFGDPQKCFQRHWSKDGMLTNKMATLNKLKDQLMDYQNVDQGCENFQDEKYSCLQSNITSLKKRKIEVSGIIFEGYEVGTLLIKKNKETGVEKKIEEKTIVSPSFPFVNYYVQSQYSVDGQIRVNEKLEKIEKGNLTASRNHFFDHFYSHSFLIGHSMMVSWKYWKYSENFPLLQELELLPTEGILDSYSSEDGSKSNSFWNKILGFEITGVESLWIDETLSEGRVFKLENTQCKLFYKFDYAVTKNEGSKYFISRLLKHVDFTPYANIEPACQNLLAVESKKVEQAKVEKIQLEILSENKIKFNNMELERKAK